MMLMNVYLVKTHLAQDVIIAKTSVLIAQVNILSYMVEAVLKYAQVDISLLLDNHAKYVTCLVDPVMEVLLTVPHVSMDTYLNFMMVQ